MPGSLLASLQAFHSASTSESRARVLRALMSSELLVPVSTRSATADGLALAFTQDGAGRTLAPAFTDERRLRTWLRTGGDYARAPARGLIATLLAGPFAGLLLNPGSDECAVVERHAMQALTGGTLPPDDDDAAPSVRGCSDGDEPGAGMPGRLP